MWPVIGWVLIGTAVLISTASLCLSYLAMRKRNR